MVDNEKIETIRAALERSDHISELSAAEQQERYASLLSFYYWLINEMRSGQSEIRSVLVTEKTVHLTKKRRDSYLALVTEFNLEDTLDNLPCLLENLNRVLFGLAEQMIVIPRVAAEIFYLWLYDNLHDAFIGWFDDHTVVELSRKYPKLNLNILIQSAEDSTIDKLASFINYVTHNPDTLTRENAIWGYIPIVKKLKGKLTNDSELAAMVRKQCFYAVSRRMLTET